MSKYRPALFLCMWDYPYKRVFKRARPAAIHP